MLGVESITCLSTAAKNKREKFPLIPSRCVCNVLKATHHLTSFSRKNLKKREIVLNRTCLSVSLPLCVSLSNQWSFVAAGAPAAANKNNTGKINSFFGARICFCSNLRRGRLVLSVGLRRTDQTSGSEKRARSAPLACGRSEQRLRGSCTSLRRRSLRLPLC